MKPASPGQSLISAIILGALAWWVFSLRTPAANPSLSQRSQPSQVNPVQTPIDGELPLQPRSAAFLTQHEAEAKKFLGTCNQKQIADKKDCYRTQDLFVYMYVKAFTGDYISAVTTAGLLLPRKKTADNRIWSMAIPPNQTEACAWSLLLMVTTSRDPKMVSSAEDACGPLADPQMAQAKARASAILRGFDLEVRVPKSWHPAIADPVSQDSAAQPLPSPEQRFLRPKDGSLINAMPALH